MEELRKYGKIHNTKGGKQNMICL